MDLDAAIDKLYGLPRERFVAERDKLAKAQPKLAERVRKLRKPTVVAGQANQLARKRRKDVAALVEVGAKLRAAQESLDGKAMRELSRQRADLVDKLVGRMPEAATGLRELLEHAATNAADDLLAGRLVTTPETTGWGFDIAPIEPAAEPERDRERERAFEEARAADAEAQAALEAAEGELRAGVERVERLQEELAAARASRDAADAAVKRARQEAQRRARELRRF
jgi:hypothetical protein